MMRRNGRATLFNFLLFFSAAAAVNAARAVSDAYFSYTIFFPLSEWGGSATPPARVKNNNNNDDDQREEGRNRY